MVRTTKMTQLARSKITFLPVGKTVDFSGCPTILSVAIHSGVSLHHSCGGNASCGTCLIIVQSGSDRLAPRNSLERDMAVDRGFGPCERLACQTTAIDGLTVKIPDPD